MMAEYIEREATIELYCQKCKGYYDGHCIHRGECDVDVIQIAPVADVIPAKIIEHIKQRILETAFNNDEIYSEVAEDIVDRIDFWVKELSDLEMRSRDKTR